MAIITQGLSDASLILDGFGGDNSQDDEEQNMTGTTLIGCFIQGGVKIINIYR